MAHASSDLCSPVLTSPLSFSWAPAAVSSWTGGPVPSWKAAWKPRLQKTFLQRFSLETDDSRLSGSDMCDFSCDRSSFKRKNSVEKQKMDQWIQDETKAQQTFPKFHLGNISELLIFFFSRKYKLLHLTERVHLISSGTASAPASTDVPQCSSFDLSSSPRCWSSSSSQDEVWVVLFFFLTFPQRTVWSGVLPSGNGAALVLLVRTFDHFSLQDLFPHPCLHGWASKHTVLLFASTPLASHTAWLVLGLCRFFCTSFCSCLVFSKCLSWSQRQHGLVSPGCFWSIFFSHEAWIINNHQALKTNSLPKFPTVYKKSKEINKPNLFLKRSVSAVENRGGRGLLR